MLRCLAVAKVSIREHGRGYQSPAIEEIADPGCGDLHPHGSLGSVRKLSRGVSCALGTEGNTQ